MDCADGVDVWDGMWMVVDGLEGADGPRVKSWPSSPLPHDCDSASHRTKAAQPARMDIAPALSPGGPAQGPGVCRADAGQAGIIR